MSLEHVVSRKKRKKIIHRFFKYSFPAILFLAAMYYFMDIPEKKRIHTGEFENEVREQPAADSIFMLRTIQDGNYQPYFSNRADKGEKLTASFAILEDTLTIEFGYTYLPQDTHTRLASNNANATLTDLDPYHLVFRTTEECFVYVFQHTSNGSLVSLFPGEKYSSQTNPVFAGNYRLPESNRWIYLDNHPGTEEIFLVSSRWRHKKLELLLKQHADEPSTNNRNAILKYIDEQLTVAEKIPGLACANISFNHIKSN